MNERIKSLSVEELRKILINAIQRYKNIEMKYIYKYILEFDTKYETEDGYTKQWNFNSFENCKSAEQNYKLMKPTNY